MASGILGLPELAPPIGFAPVGSDPRVPVGTILGGAPYEKDRLLEVAAAYQAVTSWHTERPADPVLATALSRAAATGPSRLTPERAAATSA